MYILDSEKFKKIADTIDYSNDIGLSCEVISSLNQLFDGIDSRINILAFSAGQDSMFLLLILYKLLNYRKKNISLRLCHINHNLRTSSRNEALDILNFAKNIDVECSVYNLKYSMLKKYSKNIGIEAICRQLRYCCLSDLRKRLKNKEKIDQYEDIDVSDELFYTGKNLKRIIDIYENDDSPYIFVAQHRNDLIETIFLNIVRGCGINGIVSLQEKNACLIRPLIRVSKNVISNFFSSYGLPYIQDETNLKNDYKRNIIRNSIIPNIEKNLNQDISASLIKFYDNMLELHSFIENCNKNGIIDELYLSADEVFLLFDNSKALKIYGESYSFIFKQTILDYISKLGISDINRIQLNFLVEKCNEKKNSHLNVSGFECELVYFAKKNLHMIVFHKKSSNIEGKLRIFEMNIRGLPLYDKTSLKVKSQFLSEDLIVQQKYKYKNEFIVANKKFYPEINNAVWRSADLNDYLLVKGRLLLIKSFFKKNNYPVKFINDTLVYAINDRILFIPNVFYDADFVIQSDVDINNVRYFHYDYCDSQ